MGELQGQDNPNSLLYSRSFSQTRREAPNDAPSRNHELLVQAGFIRQEAAGIYTILPFGQRVIANIEALVRGEMRGLGAEELTLPVLTPKENWDRTGRWDKIDVLFKLKSGYSKREYGLAPTTEEVATPVARERIRSYRDLPFAFYQLQEKFRDEKRAKSGIIRGREFRMKDMYSFHSSVEDFQQFYQSTIDAYLRIFDTCEVDAKVTEASGGEYTKKATHEFHALSEAGEDDIVHCTNCRFAQNQEIASVSAGDSCAKCGGVLDLAKSIEIGHIFDLGDTFTRAFKVSYLDRNGEQQIPVMGCYGIGISRLMGTVVELHNDEHGITWPEAVAPFDYHLVGLNLDDEAVRAVAFGVYDRLSRANQAVLFDDRSDASAKDKFVMADLIGIPSRLVVSKRTLQSESLEVKSRSADDAHLVNAEDIAQLTK